MGSAACTNQESENCACLPACYRLCAACGGEMCDFMGIQRSAPVGGEGNIFVHQHPDVGDPALAGVLMQCRENLMEDKS